MIAYTMSAPTGARRRAWRGLALGAALLGAAACNPDDLLDVEDPDVVTPESLTDASALPAVLAGAQAEFQAAYIGQGDDSQISLSALMTDEFFDIETFPTRVEVDQRNIQTNNTTMLTVYRRLHQARAAADQSAEAHGRLAPNVVGHSESYSLSGFASVLFGENYCSGVPFSRQGGGGALEYGDPQTTVEIFDGAVAKFDSALTTGAAAGPQGETRVNLARVGRGRALLDLGRYADAAAAVSAVPTTFQYLVYGSENSARENNGVFLLSSANGQRYAGARGEGGNGLNFIDGDPRARSVRSGSAVGFDGVNPAFYQQKYLSRAAPAVLADGIEARLIEAEAALQANDAAGLLTALNKARATRADLPLLTDAEIPAARDGQVDLLFRERAYWLWLTSHRLGDMRRLIRQYGRNSEAVFPTGAYASAIAKGGNRYFSDVNFPIPFEEQNNPNFAAAGGECLDRNP